MGNALLGLSNIEIKGTKKIERAVKGITTAWTLGEMVRIPSCTSRGAKRVGLVGREMEDTISMPTNMRTLATNKRAIDLISETAAERKAVSADWTFMLSVVRVHGVRSRRAYPTHEIS